MSQFSTNETVSLDKIIDNIENITKTNTDQIVEKYKIKNCVQWIKENNFERVCLQFPNRYLPDAVNVVLNIQKQINNKVYLLADTAYESCCIDYVAAKHINADAIIHFGESCYSQLLENEIPVLRINYQYSIDRQKIIDNLINFVSDHNSNVIYLVASERYTFLIDEIKSYLNDNQINKIKCINIKDFRRENSDFSVIFVGNEDREIANFQHFFQVQQLYLCNVNDKDLEIRQFTSNNRAVKRRNYLIEIIKDANTVGIIVGTLAVKNYLKILDRIRKLCKIHQKKCYVLSVGKPNVAKLANFPEMDVFVVIACPYNEIYDSREFYKPIVMPYDVEVALNLNINLKNIYNPYDYNEIDLDQQLDNDIIDRSKNGDVSLISGKLRGNCNVNDDVRQSDECTEMTVRNDMKLVENYSHGAVYLANRSWQGLEPKLGETEPKLATMGRVGLAKGYQNENH